MLLTHFKKGKEVQTFYKGISREVNSRLEFELAYLEATVQHINHYATEKGILIDFNYMPIRLGVIFSLVVREPRSLYIYIHYFS